jgi:hypothetical protein
MSPRQLSSRLIVHCGHLLRGGLERMLLTAVDAPTSVRAGEPDFAGAAWDLSQPDRSECPPTCNEAPPSTFSH